MMIRVMGFMAVTAIGISLAQIPAGGQWSSTGIAPYPLLRSEVQGEEIDGKFYCVGGQDETPSGAPNSDLAIYDTRTNTWTLGPKMPGPRHHVATAKHGGKFYVLGGINQVLASWPWDFGETNNWVYDPATSQWKALKPIPERFGAGDAEAVDGKIYIAGGILEGQKIARTRTWVYDIATDTWTKKADMNAAREHFRMAAIGNRIYAAAGRHEDVDVKIFEAYDIPTDKWIRLKDLPTTRGGVAVGALNGRIYVMGGEGATREAGLYNTVEEYNPADDTWKRMTDMINTRHGMAGIEYNGKFYILAGSIRYGNNPQTSNHVFTPPSYPSTLSYQTLFASRPTLNTAAGGLAISLPHEAFVQLTFFDARGQEKGAPLHLRMSAGENSVEKVPAGAAFVRAAVFSGTGATQSISAGLPAR